MEMLPTDERMCHILSTSADKTETVIPDTKTSTRGFSTIKKIGSGCNVVTLGYYTEHALQVHVIIYSNLKNVSTYQLPSNSKENSKNILMNLPCWSIPQSK